LLQALRTTGSGSFARGRVRIAWLAVDRELLVSLFRRLQLPALSCLLPGVPPGGTVESVVALAGKGHKSGENLGPLDVRNVALNVDLGCIDRELRVGKGADLSAVFLHRRIQIQLAWTLHGPDDVGRHKGVNRPGILFLDRRRQTAVTVVPL